MLARNPRASRRLAELLLFNSHGQSAKTSAADRARFMDALYTPRSESTDSEGVLLALETARALEEQGDLREAVRWIRRAAEEAEKDGNDARVLALARAAAELLNAIESVPDSVAPSSRSPLPTLPSWGSADSTIPPPPSLPDDRPPVSYVCELSMPAGNPLPEHAIRVEAIRVAISGSIRDAQSFRVERIAAGQPSPPGTTEAILVLVGGSDGSRENDSESQLRAVESKTRLP